MIIISHRGYWKSDAEKNRWEAFDRSFSLGYGTETDLRDHRESLVISHDMANESAITADAFFERATGTYPSLPLALNIKADGLQAALRVLLDQYAITDYFVFDMSIPDTLGYIRAGIRFFSRQSEYEPQPAFYEECAGIWLDAFQSVWYDAAVIEAHAANGKSVAIVSPELHKREPLELWKLLKNSGLHHSEKVILCTDLPEDATHFFSTYEN
ncbi:hypothetical protein GS398_19380 [Pedobacter sp. HMF7056]|uniref:Phosphodiesterase n=2 Tax=Hufsiella ginkgonis TaxID=2695274 RepID=A0A7K1Y2I1_9SPHI|nr:hypothetical protein [Hufsiella ginkgonis]